MARKGWGELSDAYRGRLERGGIDRARYESGESLGAARGHAKTPEHPRDAYTMQGRRRYQEYLRSMAESQKRIIDIKTRLFAGRFKWDEERARKYVLEGGTDIPKPGKRQLDAIAAMSDEEIEELISVPDVDDEWKFLYYH